GNKRLYRITDQGRAWLDENRADLDRINEQMQHVAGHMKGAAIGEEFRALAWAVKSKLRSGEWNAEQTEKAREILKKARRDLEDLWAGGNWRRRVLTCAPWLRSSSRFRRLERPGDAGRTARNWWAMTDSNRRHLRCKRSALPTELIAR